MTHRIALGLMASLAFCCSLMAQDPLPRGSSGAQDEAQQPKPDAEAAVKQWLEGDQLDEQRRDATVAAVLADARGVEVVAVRLAEAKQGPERNGMLELARHTVLGFLKREREREMVFVGQFNGLRALQPFASEFLFDLLLDTPNWYPLTWRTRVVAPLRDLESRLPALPRLERILTMVGDGQEPLDLRMAMAAMLWQWGKTESAQRFVTSLIEATAVGDAEDRVQATLQLADYYNLLREYPKAASAHRTAHALAKGAGVTLLPIAWYAAACVHSLQGEVDRGIEALSKCADMLASPDLDKSLRIERKLFEQDPEIAALRADPRYPALLERAFGKADDKQRADKQRADKQGEGEHGKDSDERRERPSRRR